MKTFLNYFLVAALVIVSSCGEAPQKIPPTIASQVDPSSTPSPSATPTPTTQAIDEQAKILAEISGTYKVKDFGCSQTFDSGDLPSFIRGIQNMKRHSAEGNLLKLQDAIKDFKAESDARLQLADQDYRAEKTKEDTIKQKLDTSTDRQSITEQRKKYLDQTNLTKQKERVLQIVQSENRERLKLASKIETDASDFFLNHSKEELKIKSGIVPALSIEFSFGDCKLRENFDIKEVRKKDHLVQLKLMGVGADQTCQDLGFQGTHDSLVRDRKIELQYDSTGQAWVDKDSDRGRFFCGQSTNERRIKVLNFSK